MRVERLEADGEHLDERAASEDRVRRVHERRGRDSGRLGRAQRGEEHAVDDQDVGRLTLELGQDVARDGRVEAEPLPDHGHLCFEVRRRPAVASQSAAGVKGMKRAPWSPQRSWIDACPIIAYVVARRDERPGDPERRHEVARAVPGDHQIASHLAPPTLTYLTACKLGYALQHVKWTPRHPDAILTAARELFEEQGYHGAGLEAVAKRAGVSRQAIYLHFASKAELLTALHAHIYETDVEPALERHRSGPRRRPGRARRDDRGGRRGRLEGLADPRGARGRPPAPPRGRRDPAPARGGALRRDRAAGAMAQEGGSAPAAMRVGTFADIMWGLTSLGTFQNLVIERGWSVDSLRRLGAPDHARPARRQPLTAPGPAWECPSGVGCSMG